MHLFDPNAAFQAGLALTVVAGMFVLFMRELYPNEVVAITGVTVLLITGILPY
jgi:multisubunit Na+/H+ antiporter MnhB subunit